MYCFDQVKSSVSTFTQAFHIRTAILDEAGTELISYGACYQYCSLFREHTGKYCTCTSTHKSSGALASHLGDCYIYACPTGLFHFSIAIMQKGIYKGSILAGPILLDDADISVVDDMLQLYHISRNERLSYFTSLSEIPVITPQSARYISKLLFLLIYNLFSDEAEGARLQQDKLAQQAKIFDHLNEADAEVNHYANQYAQEKELISYVMEGNIQGAQQILNHMIGSIYFTSGNNLEIIKIKMAELLGVLSHGVIQGGASPEQAFALSAEFQTQSMKTKNLTDLSYVLLDTLNKFIDLILFHIVSIGGTHSELIKKAIIYISKNYTHSLTLEEVSRHLSIHPSYFSTLFRKATGINFSVYVMELRIKKAKQLLKESDLSLIDISTCLGFESQQYFTRVFTKLVGMAPKQYRRKLF